MSEADSVSDLELAALISSKICHDVIGPVGAIFNGLEVLDDDDDPESRDYALSIIKDFTTQASAKVQFARFAFGAAGSAGATIDLRSAQEITTAYIGNDKHKLDWQVPPGSMEKDQVKLLLNLISAALTALPRGGTIQVAVMSPESAPSFMIRCTGQAARPPQYLPDFLSGQHTNPLDALTIQSYYTCMLAKSAGMTLGIGEDGADIVLTARS